MMALVDDPAALGLWPHQLQAVETCLTYFASGSGGAALVQYPTGTGKTGIMAVLSSIRAQGRPVLIVCPSAALVEQLQNELRAKFWDKIKAPEKWKPEHVFQLLPSTVNTLVAKMGQVAAGERVVVIGTIQALQTIHASPNYAKIRGLFGTVFFDEGHREPAPAWAKAVRGFDVKTVLFSATPFRNDLKAFDVDLDHVAFLSFERAERDALIRGIEVSETLPDLGYRAFAKFVIAERDKQIADRRFSAEHKVIVRADSADDVRALYDAFARALKGRPEKVLAVHDTFRSSVGPQGELRDSVPDDLQKRSERFLIHQFMLTEGIDDPACTMLVIHAPFSTERQLVQQAGRLTRHPGRLGTALPPALILAKPKDRVAGMWKRFTNFDRACVANGDKPPMRNNAQIAEALLQAMPDVDYVEGKFRTRLQLNEDVTSDLRVPLSAIVFQVEPDFDIEAFAESVTEQLVEEDRSELKTAVAEAGISHYHLSLAVAQTPYLYESLFQSASLEVTLYACHGEYLFLFDSGGLWIDEQKMVGNRIPPITLRRLLPNAGDVVVTALSMQNSDIGPLSIRSRSMTARSLERSGVFVGEQLHVITSASGRVATARRSLGFVRSRVREGEGPEATAAQFVEWTKSVAKDLRGATPAADLFGRFASPVPVPAAVIPLNILVDLDGFADEFLTEGDLAVEFDLDNVCVDVASDPNGPEDFKYGFPLTVNGETHQIWMKWDSNKEKFWLKSDELSHLKVKGRPNVSLMKRLNQQQPFRIILQGADTLYAFGDFYRVNLDLSPTGAHGRMLLSLIEAIPGLDKITSEKGELVAPAASWPAKSLFGFIDAELHKPNGALGPSFPQLVCDDLGNEAADFIGADTDPSLPRATMIAAKWKDGVPGVSASRLYDVSAQVVKNLAYLKVDATDLPASLDKWTNDWKLNGGTVPRIRAGSTAKAFRETYSNARAMPSARRAMWMVLGGGVLSRSKLSRSLSQPKLRAEVLQLYHLVLSTYAACQSVGVDLRLFCAE